MTFMTENHCLDCLIMIMININILLLTCNVVGNCNLLVLAATTNTTSLLTICGRNSCWWGGGRCSRTRRWSRWRAGGRVWLAPTVHLLLHQRLRSILNAYYTENMRVKIIISMFSIRKFAATNSSIFSFKKFVEKRKMIKKYPIL